MNKIISIIICILLTFQYLNAAEKKPVQIVLSENASAREIFGANHLQTTLQAAGYKVTVVHKNSFLPGKKNIFIELTDSSPNQDLKKEGFSLKANGNSISILGNDASGALYGCYELADKIKISKQIPEQISEKDAPEMVLRGQCIGLQKPYYLTGRTVYEYPYTEETFPWFYDKMLWIQVLDSMVQNRMNSLYLWNGHPFASLVRLKDYPYAVEVDDATFKKNEEVFRFLTKEADKRGIWVIQMFYNIIVSKPFAEKHGLKTQERERPIIPVIADYTRKSIAAFVAKYPNVGLLITLGEAMEGVGKDDVDWFTKTIIPGVKDGMAEIGLKKEPPIILRAHDTDAPAVMHASLRLYKNLFTMAKFNGEALTYETPRGKWQELHKKLSSLGSVHVENVHILANLEPFRYGSPAFIQRSVVGMHEALGGNGLHLYPQASYWDWPYTADIVKGSRLLEIERNWIWYKAWSRYAWKAYRDKREEKRYWANALADKFGVNESQGMQIVTSYDEMGEIAPKLLRRFGITDGNCQTLTLGMLMTQLINPYRFGLFTLLYESEAPEGESLSEYAEKDWKAQPHFGETPPDVIRSVKQNGDNAVKAIDAVSDYVSKNKEEFDRLKNDAHIYKELAYHFAFKAKAALAVLRYKYSNEIKNLDTAFVRLAESVKWYQTLNTLTKPAYLYANSMQTGARKIPLSGSGGKYKNWREMLPVFENELSVFKMKIDSLKKLKPGAAKRVLRFENAQVKFDEKYQFYEIDTLTGLFCDSTVKVLSFVPELKGLRGIKTAVKSQLENRTEIHFSNKKPIKVLVGFFEPQKAAFSVDTTFLKQPELETNATANDYGQAETKIANAMIIAGWPQLHIHSYEFKPGNNRLKLEKGVALILGFIDSNAMMPPYDAGLYESGNRKQVDWLFE